MASRSAQVAPAAGPRLVEHGHDPAQVRAGGDLGHDAARRGVQGDLRGDHVAEDPPPALDQGDAGLVARRLDGQDQRSAHGADSVGSSAGPTGGGPGPDAGPRDGSGPGPRRWPNGYGRLRARRHTAGLAEMIRGGTTTYCDMYYFEDAIADETFKAGVRGVLGETVIDFPVADNKTYEEGHRLRRDVLSTNGKGTP